jgi:hypothetical protein
MRRFLRENGLSLVLFFCFFFTFIAGQAYTGYLHQNEELREHGRPTESLGEYILGTHFLEATMENFESEFLQMFLYVMLTVFLYQKGSSESKDPDKEEAVDRDPRQSKNKKDAPWPVRKGGFVLKLYENSLCIAFTVLFLLSFYLHAVGGAGEYNQDQEMHGRPERVTTFSYMSTSRFWFESFQNWQSEFLALAAMVYLSIWLRQRGSPESKPVDAPHSQTGTE